MNRLRVPTLVILVGMFSWFAWAGEPSANDRKVERSQDEQVLRNAGIATDGPALLQYLRSRTSSEEQQTILKQRAAQLGSSVYSVRVKASDELIRAGRLALPWLRQTANTTDVETVRRAQYCIQVIEQNTRLGLSATVSRVLAERKVPGSAQVLLAYLPFVDEAWVEEEIRQSLKRVAYAEGNALPVFVDALGSADPKRRAAAAWIVGESRDPTQRQLAIQRLKDVVPEVRLRAASSLLAAQESAAVEPLIELLSAQSHELAWLAEDLLFHLAGASGPAVWLDSARDDNGGKVRAAWEAWWKINAGKIDWKSFRLGEQPLGLTLVVENQRPNGAGRIYETDQAGVVRWQVSIQNPIDAQWLPGGRLLVSDSRASQIYEMDTRGLIGWKHAGIAATSCQRLPNGNTVISTYQNIIEFTREGKTVFTYATPGHTFHARKLPDGRYIWLDACGEIGEIDGAGKDVARTKVAKSLAWGSIERLRNGHYLVALGGVGKVQELDMAGKIYWEIAVNNPNRALRLANGNTLVVSHGDQCVYEFDPNGVQRWKHGCVGRPFAVARR